MTNSTLTQIRTKLKNDCNLYDDTFVDVDTELLGYINEAIDDCEALIHGLYEDYFLVRSTLTLVSGTATISLPSDIFANKVRRILYDDGGSKKYEVRRFKNIAETMYYTESTLPYKYMLTNDSSNGPKIRLYPTPAESNSNLVIWYIRNAKTLSSGSDECDIPEFINFIYAHAKWNVARKEKYGVDLQVATAHLDTERKLLEATLADMVPDEGNDIRPDFSFYQDFDALEQY